MKPYVAWPGSAGPAWFRRHGALVQELVPPHGYDLRILVAAGEVVGAAKRLAAPGDGEGVFERVVETLVRAVRSRAESSDEDVGELSRTRTRRRFEPVLALRPEAAAADYAVGAEH